MDEQAVYYGSLWGSGKDRQPGRPLNVQRRFIWAGQPLYVPAVYLCAEGIVIDLCRRVDPEAIRRFADKWNLSPENDDIDLFSPAQQLQMEAENPLTLDLNAAILVDGREYPMKESSSAVWNSCFEPDADDDTAARLVRQYGLDPAFSWNLCRMCFPYTAGQELRSLSLTLREEPRPLPGPCFSTDGTQTDFVFTFPPDGTQHTLHIEEYRQETLDDTFTDENWEYPRQFTEMIYTLTPDLDSSLFQLRDCSNGDPARRRLQPPPSPLAEKYGLLPTASHAAFVGVIGAGVSAVCTGESAPLHSACSAVYFTPPERVDWMLVYDQKGADDITVDLWN